MPKPILDLTGQRFNFLTVLSFSHRNKKKYFWRVRCDCGTEKIIARYALIKGTTKSCGCLHAVSIGNRRRKHGMSSSGIYHSWHAMKQRCCFLQNQQYKNYGARGIKICKRWEKFENFLADMKGTWFPKATLERKNVNGNYSPSNCCWLPKIEQERNKRNSVIIDTPWGRMNMTYAARKLGISPSTMSNRIEKWPKEKWFKPSPYQNSSLSDL